MVLLSLPVDPVLPYFALIAEDEVDGGPIVGYPEVRHLTVDVVEMEAECMWKDIWNNNKGSLVLFRVFLRKRYANELLSMVEMLKKLYSA